MDIYDYLYFLLAMIAFAIPVGAGVAAIKDWWL